MEPVTHMLTGAVLARAGFNRKAAYATAAMVIAAEFPDLDISWTFAGPVTSFLHHRGITHTLVAIPFEAALITAYFWFTHRFRKRAPAAPPNWLWLFLGCWLALASHLLLDWTNNYGLRPFFPFDPHWYAGSFVFIFEPILFAMLLIALIAPWLFGIVGSEIGARQDKFRGRGWAIAALIAIAALYVMRFNEHAKAIEIAAANQPEGTTRIFASPHPVNPFLWSTVSDTPTLYQLSTVDTWRGVVAPATPSDTLYKGPVSLPILVAKRSYLGRVYLDWSMYPVITQTAAGDPTHPLVEVKFADARFMYDTLLDNGKSDPPITGTVLLDMAAPEPDRVIETRMNGHTQRAP